MLLASPAWALQNGRATLQGSTETRQCTKASAILAHRSVGARTPGSHISQGVFVDEEGEN